MITKGWQCHQFFSRTFELFWRIIIFVSDGATWLTVAVLSRLIERASGLTVGTQKSSQWDSAEWFLAWFYLQEVKPYLRPDSNPVFSGIEVLLTASVREENHAENLSYWGWTVKERLEREEGVMLSCLAYRGCTEARNCPLTHIYV